MTSTDVAIVGAGPIGIELAIALKQRGIPYLHFDARQIGQTMYWWPPNTRWFSSNDRIAIAGVPLQTADQSKATREEYLRYLRSVVIQFDLAINTYEPVIAIEKTPDTGDGFLLRTRSARGEQTYPVRAVVLATGGTAAPRMLGIPGEDLPHVSHYLEDPHKYFRRRILIVGGKNSAAEAALRLHQAGAHVSLSYRRDALDAHSIKYWIYPELTGLIKAGRIRGYFNTIVTRITPSHATLVPCLQPTGDESQKIGDRVQASVRASLNPEPRALDPEPEKAASGLQHLVSSIQDIEIPADFVLLLVGYVADMSLARAAGVELRGRNEVPVYNEQTMETNIPGLYIAGTATAGTQERFRVFVENCHIHVDRIVASLTGQPPPPPPAPEPRPET